VTTVVWKLQAYSKRQFAINIVSTSATKEKEQKTKMNLQ